MSDAVVSAVERVSDMDSYDVEKLAAVSQWVVGLESASGAALKADSLGAEYLSEALYLDNLSIWEFPSQDTWQTVVDTLGSEDFEASKRGQTNTHVLRQRGGRSILRRVRFSCGI